MKKTGLITSAAVLVLLTALIAGEALAAGRGGGGAGRGGSSVSGTGTTTRPAGSQRRDGTFATTGTTASGATTRPGNGQGLQDGSRLNQ